MSMIDWLFDIGYTTIGPQKSAIKPNGFYQMALLVSSGNTCIMSLSGLKLGLFNENSARFGVFRIENIVEHYSVRNFYLVHVGKIC